MFFSVLLGGVVDLIGLQKFGEEIWLADGPTTDVAGFRYPTRMAVIRLSSGALFIWSPVALNDELRAAVDALGEVRFLIAPNSLHHLFLGEWRRAYPAAKTYAPPGLRERRKDIEFDGDLGDAPASGWADQIDQVVVRGNLITSEVVFFHRQSRTAIFTDLIQHFSPTWFSGWRAVVARLDLMTGPEPQVPRKFRAAFTNRRAARAAVQRILAWPAKRVVMAHAAPIEDKGQAFIARAFRWLSVPGLP
jgi:sirohydrochlorin ferrochelatase